MRFSISRTSRSSRPRLLPSTVELLEVRALLSSAAVIQWKMTPEVALDSTHGDQLDLPNTSAYVNPPGGYGVTLNASGSRGALPTSTFSWKITGAKGFAEYLAGEDPTLSLPQGKYSVKLEASGLLGSSKTVSASTTMQVKDVLIVSIGDSYASGEGNPDVPGYYTLVAPQWAYSPDPSMEQQNADAHRSTLSGPAEFALQLQQANPHEAVTFVSVANSGASIPQGLLGPMTSIGDPSVQLPAEVAEVKQIIGSRPIDVLTLSVGGNDVGFVTQIENLVENTATLGFYPSLTTIQSQVTAALKALPGQYAKLETAIKGLDPAKVLVTDYPDLTRNQAGAVSSIPGPLGTTLVSQADAQFASKDIVAPLDAAIAAAAKANHWTLADLTAAFATHGYPSTSTFIRQLGESLQIEGNLDGTFHPNAAGEAAIAAQILAAYQGK